MQCSSEDRRQVYRIGKYRRREEEGRGSSRARLMAMMSRSLGTESFVWVRMAGKNATTPEQVVRE